MQLFQYKAFNKDGNLVSDVLQAINIVAAKEHIYNNGLELVACRIAKQKKVSIADKLNLYQSWTYMLAVKVDIKTIFSDLAKTQRNKFIQEALTSSVQMLEKGMSLYTAMSFHTNIFDHMLIAMIKLAEHSSSLEDVILLSIKKLKHSILYRKNLYKALRYPAIVMIVVCSMVYVMFDYVLPKVTDFFQDEAITINILIVKNIFFWMLTFIIFAIVFVRLFMRFANDAMQNFIIAIFYKIPIIGGLYKKKCIAWIACVLSIALKANIDIAHSLSVLESISYNPYIKKRIKEIRDYLIAGCLIEEALKRSNIFTNSCMSLISAGCMTNNLQETLYNIYITYTDEAHDRMLGTLQYIEPLLVCAIGITMCFIVLTFFGPLYDISFNVAQSCS